MPVNRMRMRPWLTKMIDSKTISGLEWTDKVSAYSSSSCSSCCHCTGFQQCQLQNFKFPQCGINKYILCYLIHEKFRDQLQACCVHSRIKPPLPFHGSTQPVTAGIWRKMPVSSRSGPFTQVSIFCQKTKQKPKQITKQNTHLRTFEGPKELDVKIPSPSPMLQGNTQRARRWTPRRGKPTSAAPLTPCPTSWR